MASTRDGGTYAIQRDFLWRNFNSRRCLSLAPDSTLTGPVPTGRQFGGPHRRGYSRTWHYRRAGERGCQNFPRLRVVNASWRGVCRDRNGLEMDRSRSHPGTRHGPYVAVPACAIDAPRLSPDAFRIRGRDLTYGDSPGGSASKACTTVALPLG